MRVHTNMKTVLAVVVLVVQGAYGFVARNSRWAPSPTTSLEVATMPDLTFTPPDTTGIEEQACIDAAQKMKRVAVPVSKEVSPSGSVGISYIHWKAPRKSNAPPLLLIHGFDSSGLEYRRLGPKLAAEYGVDTYAVDILGWGFTQYDGVTSFSANSKVEALQSFVNPVNLQISLIWRETLSTR